MLSGLKFGLLSALPVLADVVHAQFDRDCFWPDGSPSSETEDSLQACNLEGVSSCCGTGQNCLSNGLCFTALRGLVYRGGCTDSQWSNSTACPKFCTDNVNWANVVNCFDGTIWCSNDVEGSLPSDSCSSTTGELHTYISGTVLALNASTTTTSTTTTSSTTSATSTIAATGSCVSSGVPIGVGLGVGLPLLLAVAALGIMYGRERKLRKSVRRGSVVAASPESDGGNEMGSQEPKGVRYQDDGRVLLQQPAMYELGSVRETAELPLGR